MGVIMHLQLVANKRIILMEKISTPQEILIVLRPGYYWTKSNAS